MPIETDAPQMSTIVYLLRSGGSPFLAFGLLLAIAGIVLILIRPSRTLVLIYAVVSLIPGLLAMVAVFGACSEFIEMSGSPQLLKPTDFANVAGRGMSCGFFGLFSTLISSLLAALAFFRAPRPVNSTEV